MVLTLKLDNANHICVLIFVRAIAVWEKHATPAGTLALFVCLAGGSLYKQAPMRKIKENNDKDVDAHAV